MPAFGDITNVLLTGLKTNQTLEWNGANWINIDKWEYAHPTGDGYSHVPATGTGNSGKILKAGATANSAFWGTLDADDVGALPASGGTLTGTLACHGYRGRAGFSGAYGESWVNLNFEYRSWERVHLWLADYDFGAIRTTEHLQTSDPLGLGVASPGDSENVARANHVHPMPIAANIKAGTEDNKPLITGTGGAITAGSFGTGLNDFCRGNDSRLSDARTPTSHTHKASDITSEVLAIARLPTIVEVGTADVDAPTSHRALTTNFLTYCETNVTLSGTTTLLVVAFFQGYGSRSSGTDDHGASFQVIRATSTSVIAETYAAFMSGGASGASTIGGGNTVLTTLSLGSGTHTFKLQAKYFGSSGYLVRASIQVFKLFK
jgi:hypothetical protein